MNSYPDFKTLCSAFTLQIRAVGGVFPVAVKVSDKISSNKHLFVFFSRFSAYSRMHLYSLTRLFYWMVEMAVNFSLKL